MGIAHLFYLEEGLSQLNCKIVKAKVNSAVANAEGFKFS